MKSFEYVAIAIALGGGILHKFGIPGADIFVIIGLGALAFLYALTGSVLNKVQEKRGAIMPFTVLSSILLAVGVVSLIFSHMGWSYHVLLALVSFIGLPIVLLINLYYMNAKSENPLHKMIVIRAAILILALIIF
jgi:hypothetical protein